MSGTVKKPKGVLRHRETVVPGWSGVCLFGIGGAVLVALKSKLAAMKERAAKANDGHFVAPLPNGSWTRLPEMPLLSLCDPA